jgi:small-conductance mechanosensitive channel
MTERETHSKLRSWIVGGLFGLIALAALVSGSAWGHVTSKALDPRLIGWSSAGALLLFGTLATTRLSRVLARHAMAKSMPSAEGAVRIVSAGVGYLIVIFGVLSVLNVQIDKLLVGAGLAGIVLGIAAQQSLGNVFAGLVLILARPFRVGDRIRVRSGALGGIFDARVREMSLTYVTLQSDDGEWKIPNSAMLAAGVIRTPRTPLAPPPASVAPQATRDGAGDRTATTANPSGDGHQAVKDGDRSDEPTTVGPAPGTSPI